MALLLLKPSPREFLYYHNVQFKDTPPKGNEMSQIEVERFLGRLITDANFRSQAAGSIERICFIKGFSLSTAEMSFLRDLDFALVSLVAEAIDDSIKRM